MTADIVRYEFSPDVPMDEVESSLAMAILATENLHGAVQVRLDVVHAMDATKRACAIDATTPAGLDLNRLFLGRITRALGPDAFIVQKFNRDQLRDERNL